MKNYLSLSNSKLKKDNIFTWGIPAYKSESGMITCPNAGECLKGCYARQGFYVMPTVRQAQEARLELSLTDNFVSVMDAEIKRRKVKRLRIHDSGDFFSVDYLNKWLNIMHLNPNVVFYAYTKMVKLFKAKQKLLPANFHVIYSEGGTQDKAINQATDRHSRVFETLKQLRQAKYSNAYVSDKAAMQGKQYIGLVYHGAPSKQWNTRETANEKN